MKKLILLLFLIAMLGCSIPSMDDLDEYVDQKIEEMMRRFGGDCMDCHRELVNK